MKSNMYAGFLLRLCANIIDWLVFILFWSALYLFFVIINMTIGKPPKNIFIFYGILNITFLIINNIYIPKIFGGTLGKLILKMKIVKVNLSPINWKEAFLRYIVVLIWNLYNEIINIRGVILTSNEKYDSFTEFGEFIDYTNLFEPKFTVITTILINIWTFSELIVLLTNDKKRSLQDFMAGTVVINRRIENKKIKESTNGV